MATNGTDLRIYYGNARVILRADDPRTQAILALVVKDALPASGETCIPVPTTDEAFLDLVKRFLAFRSRR